MTELRALLALAGLLARGDGAAAQPEIESALARAAELIETTGAALYSAQLREQRAALMHALGEDGASRQELAAARRLYEEMGAEGRAERLAGALTS
jgi:hypothetical protein